MTNAKSKRDRGIVNIDLDGDDVKVEDLIGLGTLVKKGIKFRSVTNKKTGKSLLLRLKLKNEPQRVPFEFKPHPQANHDRLKLVSVPGPNALAFFKKLDKFFLKELQNNKEANFEDVEDVSDGLIEAKYTSIVKRGKKKQPPAEGRYDSTISLQIPQDEDTSEIYPGVVRYKRRSLTRAELGDLPGNSTELTDVIFKVDKMWFTPAGFGVKYVLIASRLQEKRSISNLVGFDSEDEQEEEEEVQHGEKGSNSIASSDHRLENDLEDALMKQLEDKQRDSYVRSASKMLAKGDDAELPALERPDSEMSTAEDEGGAGGEKRKKNKKRKDPPSHSDADGSESGANKPKKASNDSAFEASSQFFKAVKA